MKLMVGLLLTLLILCCVGVGAWYLERREREERMVSEALETSQLLDESLEERLHEIDQYRHELAALLQRLGLEQVRAAEEQASKQS